MAQLRPAYIVPTRSWYGNDWSYTLINSYVIYFTWFGYGVWLSLDSQGQNVDK